MDRSSDARRESSILVHYFLCVFLFFYFLHLVRLQDMYSALIGNGAVIFYGQCVFLIARPLVPTVRNGRRETLRQNNPHHNTISQNERWIGRILNLTDSIGQHACLFACMGATYSMLDTCGGSNRYLIVARTCAWIIGPNDQKCTFAKALGVVDVHLYHVRGERI